jgi:glutathione S-transferase
MAGYGSLAKVLDVIEAAIDPARNGGRDYLVGAHFTAADVYLGSQLAFGLMFKTIEPRPIFVAYVGKISSRPAAVRARGMDDALAPMPAG